MPFRALWITGMTTARMLSDAQLVMAQRLAGLAGARRLPDGEAQRMVTEKAEAAAEMGAGLTRAMLSGKGTNAVARAVLTPLARRTRANARRLRRSEAEEK